MQVSVRVVESANRLVYLQPIGLDLSGFIPQEKGQPPFQSGPSDSAVRCAKKMQVSDLSNRTKEVVVVKAIPQKTKPPKKGQPWPQPCSQNSVQRQRVRKPKSR